MMSFYPLVNTTNKQIVGVFSFTVIFSFMISYFLVVQTEKTSLAQNAEIASLLQSQYKQAVEVIEALGGYKEQVEELNKFIRSVGGKETDDNQLLVLLSLVLQKSGLQVHTLLPLHRQSGQYIKVVAQGDYHSLMKGLSALSQATTLLTPSEVEITSSKEQLHSEVTLVLKVNLPE